MHNTARILCALVAIALLAPAAAGGREAERWTLRTTDDGATHAEGRHVALSWSGGDDRGTRVGVVVVDGHPVVRSLTTPYALGGPDTRGAVLELVGIGNPDFTPHMKIRDNPAGVLDFDCGVPPEPVSPDPCVIAFPAGHTLAFVEGGGRGDTRHVVDVLMEDPDTGGIIPCIRVVVLGEIGIGNPDFLEFDGSLHLVKRS